MAEVFFSDEVSSLTEALRQVRELAERRAGEIQSANAARAALAEHDRATAEAAATLRSERDRDRESAERARELAVQRQGQVEVLEATVRRLEALLQQQKPAESTPRS